jgi:hypothetical protein
MQAQTQTGSKSRVKPIARRAYRLNEIAASLGASPSFVRLEIGRGHLKAFHLGGAVFVAAEEFERYLTDC